MRGGGEFTWDRAKLYERDRERVCVWWELMNNGKIIRYFRSTINTCFLLLYE